MAAIGAPVTLVDQSDAFTLSVWLCSTVGMLLVNALALVLGAALRERLSAKVISAVSGVVFIGFGLLVLARTFI